MALDSLAVSPTRKSTAGTNRAHGKTLSHSFRYVPARKPVFATSSMPSLSAISDQSVGDAAEIEEAIPVGVVARHAGDFQGEHDADVAEGHFRGQACEAGALGESGAGHPRSSSMTSTCSLAQPNWLAFSTKAYWRAVDSRLYSTWVGVDWRM